MDYLNILKKSSPYILGWKDMKRAAIIVPIIKDSNGLSILFEVRASTLKHQPNEICFPGGKIDEYESPVDAAIREFYEELGVSNSSYEIISELDLFISPNNLIIHPFVALINRPLSLSINQSEVNHTFTVPIDYLLKYKPDIYMNQVTTTPAKDFPYNLIPNGNKYNFAKGSYKTLFYKYDDYIIWGITATILNNFLEKIRTKSKL